MMGAILRNTVPAMIITSASRGVPRITSAPKRARSNFGVMLVAISTKQQDNPKWKGHIEFFLPHRRSPCTVLRRMLCRTASSIVPVPRVAVTGSCALLSHQFMRFFFFDFFVSAQDLPAVRAEVERAVTPFVNQHQQQEYNKEENSEVPHPAQLVEGNGP